VRARWRRWGAAVLACLVGGYAAALLVYNPLTLSLFGGSDAAVPLADFGSFYASGLAARQGLDPYGVYPLTLDANLGRGAAVNLNAPFSVVLFEGLTAVDPVTARRLWFLATLVAYGLMLGLLVWQQSGFRSPLAIAWALLLTGFVETVLLGQVYVVLALLSTTAWVLLQYGGAASLRSLPHGLTLLQRTSNSDDLETRICQRQWLIASVLIGFVVAFKPNFLLWPAFLLLAGYWRVAVGSVLTAVIFGAIPAVLYGPGVYAQWLSALRLEQVNAQVANASLPGLLARDGAASPLALAAGALVSIGLAVWVWRRRPDAGVTSGVALVGLLLASPLAWVGYTVFLLPVVARSRVTLTLIVACVLLCLPRLVLQAWADDSVWLAVSFGAAYTVAWSILLVHAVRSKS
jgi:alpha-1,2-mannosyltransferase